MPLSDREQQILQEIEKNLLDEDPDLARGRFSSVSSRGTKQTRIGVLVFTVGVASLIGFFLSAFLVLGVVAFGAMVGGLVLITGGLRGNVESKKFRDFGPGRRVGEAIERWEQRLRDRYRRSD